MESGPGSQAGAHLPGLVYPSWSRRSLYLKGALMFIILSTHFQWAASKRDKTITVPTINGPWNKTLKTQGLCLEFHGENLSAQFFYWPEDDPEADFDHCCTTTVDSLSTYTYGIYGTYLKPRKYFDLGLIDECLPYWKCNHLFQTIFKITIYYAYCEMTDLQKLFKRRFWMRTVLKHGLLQSAIPFIVSLEVLVIFLVALYWYTWRRPVNGLINAIITGASEAWVRDIWKTLLKDWIHLFLLAMIGNGLIEAVGRQNPYTPQSKAFFNYAQLYTVLSVLVWCSSVLQQVSYWIAEIEMYYAASCEAAAREAAERGRAVDFQPVVGNTNSAAPPATPRSLSHQRFRVSELMEKIGLDDDWKWQPIAAQAGIMFCLWGFLTYTSDDDDGSTTGALFGLVVAGACPWSGLYAWKVIVRAMPWLYRNLSKPRRPGPHPEPRRNFRGLWRSVMHLQKWSGKGPRAGDGLAQPQDSAAFLELLENEP